MERRVLKWVVPVDDQDHPIGSGPVVLTAVQRLGNAETPAGFVTVWTEETGTPPAPLLRSARVYGTGQPVPEHDEHIGSCIDGPLVWHVYASTRPPAPLQAVTS